RDQPFFAVFNDMTTHQSRSMVWPQAAFEKHVAAELSPSERHDPAEVPLPPYYPDTALVRQELARYYDCVTAMDRHVGQRLAELRADGLEEETIVFFYSDHGSGMPRHKRLLHDSGLRVPLIVKFPEKFQHLAPAAPGAVIDALVMFADFGPTVLNLLGIKVPADMEGRAFLGEGASRAGRSVVYGARDRVDEVYDCARSVRDGRWLYLRNFHPHLGWAQPSVFCDLGVVRGEILHFAGARTAAQRHYVSATRPVEEFFDTENDPWNVMNLAETKRTPEQEAALKRMRMLLKRERSRLLDQGALPEDEMWSWIRAEGAPLRDVLLGKTTHRPDLESIWDAADLVGTGSIDALAELLSDGEPARRYWGVIGLRHAAFDDAAVRGRLVDHLLDASAAVRIEVAGWLGHFPETREAALEVLATDLKAEDWWVALRACRAVELLGKDAASMLPQMRAIYAEHRHQPGDASLYLAFSSGAFLEALGEPTEPWDFTPEAKQP
ncbi:MAG: sulfatase-like hydrolase/transferase, partial [Verrucomicrobiales bacterium]|nr:sulfatase-like hydrolase/transferase [Verrucomicrobiales bacterium]